jgi:hypothetical protein
MKNKKQFQIAEKIIREAITRIDPYSLLADGSPDDEFDSEITAIVGQLNRCNSSKDVAHAIARVLNSSFCEKHQPEEFEDEGLIIYKSLVQHGIKEI